MLISSSITQAKYSRCRSSIFQEAQEGHQDNQGQADTVHPQVVKSVDRRDPGYLFLELDHAYGSRRPVEDGEKVY
jgi:hypothetical protein